MLGFMDQPAVRVPVYAGFALVVFLAAAAFTFPDDQIKEIAAVQIEQALGGEYRVTIADLDAWWLTGVALEGVTIEERVAPAEAEELTGVDAEVEEAAEEAGLPEDLPVKVTIDQIAARLSILRSLMNLAPAIEYAADLGGGVISGYYVQGSDGRELTVVLDDIDLRQTPALAALTGVPFFGVIDGEIALELHPTKPIVRDGIVDITGEKLTVGPATVKTDKFPPMTYFEIPQTNLGTLNIEMQVEEGEGGRPTLEITDFESSGRDVRTEIWGDLGLATRPAQSSADLNMRLQLDETFVTKNNLAPLLNVAEVRRGKNKDWFGFRLNGRLNRIQFRGTPAAARGPTQRAAGGAAEAGEGAER